MSLRAASLRPLGAAGGEAFSHFEATVRPAAHVSFHAVGARGVLFDSATQRLYLVNRLGGFVWCCLAEGAAVAEIAHELAQRANGDVHAAATSIQAAIGEWRMRGLLAGTSPPEDHVDTSWTATARRRRPPALVAQPSGTRTRACRVLGVCFGIRFWDRRLEDDCFPLLRPHLVEVSPNLVATMDVVRSETGVIAIMHDDETMQVLDGATSVAPAVFASLMRLALSFSANFPALHAAVVRNGDGVVLFPGASGCGKSTLMAELLAAGRDVLGDDTVVFKRDSLQVCPLTPLLCVKSGAWPVLAERLPALRRAPEYLRADGHRVRYLQGRDSVACAEFETGDEVNAVVFARYRLKASPRLTRIGGFLAFHSFLASFDPIGHRLTADDIDRLIGWLNGVPCYAMSYDSLTEATVALQDVLA